MRHIPVLLSEIMEGLAIKEGITFVDCNLGDGGHSEEVIRKTKGDVSIIGIDLDADALSRARMNLESLVEEMYTTDTLSKKPEIDYVRQNFQHIEVIANDLLSRKNRRSSGGVDAILFDLGLSSYELEESGRGFSFKNDDPLSMTFGNKDEYVFTAEDIVNKWDIEHLETIIRSYGEEKFAGRIARTIVEARDVAEIKTARVLADLIRSAYPKNMRYGRIHPATKTFQALRIAVNNELESLQTALPGALNILKPGGRLAVISYHSLEDRIVKNFFKNQSEDSEGDEAGGEKINKRIKLLTKKPIVPKPAELEKNPRSRSAKLRIIEKL